MKEVFCEDAVGSSRASRFRTKRRERNHGRSGHDKQNRLRKIE